MRIMTIPTTHLSLNDRVMIGKIKLTTLIQMTFEANLRRFSGIDDRVSGSAALVVNTAGPMAGFAANIFRVGSFSLQTSVRGRVKISHDVAMTFFAALGASKFSTGNLGGGNNCASYS